MLLPIIQNLIKVSPALVHSIGTGKKCRITHQTVFQQAYIRIPRFLIVLVIAEVHLHGFRNEVIKVYQSLRPLTDKYIRDNVIRGQYIAGDDRIGS